MNEYGPGFETPVYPAKTFTQAYLDATFRDAIATHGSTHRDVWLDPTSPGLVYQAQGLATESAGLILAGQAEINTGYRTAHETITTSNGGLKLCGFLSQREDYFASSALVEPYRIGASVSTVIGSVLLDVTLPSEELFDQPGRERDPEELMPPHARIHVVAGHSVFAADVFRRAGQESRELPADRHRRALAALQTLATRTGAPDWSDGSYQLRADDMDQLMDYLCAFWEVNDPRQHYPQWERFWELFRHGSRPVPDLNWRPYSERHHGGVIPPTAPAGTPGITARRFPSGTYGTPVVHPPHVASDQQGPQGLSGLLRHLRLRKRRD